MAECRNTHCIDLFFICYWFMWTQKKNEVREHIEQLQAVNTTWLDIDQK